MSNLFENLQMLYEYDTLLEMSNLRGKDVKKDYVNFSYYFSRKDGNPHGIRVKVLFNRDRMTSNEDGFLILHSDWKFINSSNKHIKEKEINSVKEYFKKYKVLFAAVWEEYLDAPDLEDYMKARITWKDLLIEMMSTNEEANTELENIYEIEDITLLESIVRKYKLFNMND